MKTTLAIGFTNKYYTLWSITTDTNYVGTAEAGYRSYETINYCYIQNLSMDLEEAQAKAKLRGVTNLTPDDELKGKNRNFGYTRKLYSEIPREKLSFFDFGKYAGQLITTSTDLKYIEWYCGETNNKFCKEVLLNNGYIDNDGEIISKDRYEQIMNKKATDAILESTDFIVVEAERNLKYDEGDRLATGKFQVNGADVTFFFSDFREMYYNGYSYALPLTDGKAKRIKGKKIKISYRVDSEVFDSKAYFVNKVEILN